MKSNNFGQCFDRMVFCVTFRDENGEETVKNFSAKNAYHLMSALAEAYNNKNSGLPAPSTITEMVEVTRIDRAFTQFCEIRSQVRTIGKDFANPS